MRPAAQDAAAIADVFDIALLCAYAEEEAELALLGGANMEVTCEGRDGARAKWELPAEGGARSRSMRPDSRGGHAIMCCFCISPSAMLAVRSPLRPQEGATMCDECTARCRDLVRARSGTEG